MGWQKEFTGSTPGKGVGSVTPHRPRDGSGVGPHVTLAHLRGKMLCPRSISVLLYGQNAASELRLLRRKTSLSPAVMLFHMLCSISVSLSLSSHPPSKRPSAVEFMERASTSTYKYRVCNELIRNKICKINYINNKAYGLWLETNHI